MISSTLIKSKLNQAFSQTDLSLPGKHTGKVRDSYLLPEQKRLLITTDRLSAFDRVLKAVPYKGQVLNQLAAWWFKQTEDIIDNHLISLPDPNALIAQNVQPFPIEVIVRGYISGVTSTALWYRYSLGERNIYGYDFPEGLRKNQFLPKPIITPTTKGDANGHDERLTCQEVTEKKLVDPEAWEIIQKAALALFARGQELAKRAGLLLVDTKYEFGRTPDGKIILIDEIHTPDSSRFWIEDTYETHFTTGVEPENFDKEFLRLAYTERGYRGEGEPPEMPDDLWIAASERYIRVYELLTGQTFEPGEYPVMPRLIENLKKKNIIPA